MTSEERHKARYLRRKAKREFKKAERNKEFDNFEKLLNPGVYAKSFRECRKGVVWKHSVQYFEMHLLKNIHDIIQTIGNGNIVTRGFVDFDINERGKMRHIRSPHISERVVQKALCNECLVPVLTRPLIYDNGACLKNKGTSFARKRIVRHLSEYYRKHGNSGYVLTIDFKKYFDSIDHEQLLELVKEQVKDERLFSLVKMYVEEFGNKGLGLGCQVSQNLAVFFPNKIDHYIKEVLRIRYYGRYMDDSYLISDSKEMLEDALSDIKAKCEKIGITLNPKKTRIQNLKKGIKFLHCRYSLTDKGRVLKNGGKESVKRERRRLKALKVKLGDGIYSAKEISEFYRSWRGFMMYFDSRRKLKNTDKLYNKLFCEV